VVSEYTHTTCRFTIKRIPDRTDDAFSARPPDKGGSILASLQGTTASLLPEWQVEMRLTIGLKGPFARREPYFPTDCSPTSCLHHLRPVAGNRQSLRGVEDTKGDRRHTHSRNDSVDVQSRIVVA
jgi:hypothetical protein